MTTSVGSKVAARIFQLRISKKMTQEQLAEKADVDASVISRLERGSRSNIRLDTLDKIVKALGVDYSSIFSFSDSNHAKTRIDSKLDLITDQETLETIEKLVDLLTDSQK